jgi:hypothetical protein
MEFLDTPTAVPEGYAAVPVTPDQLAAPLRICVLAKVQRDPSAGLFVTVRDTIDAQVLLGCVTDSSGNVHQWVEIWIQNVGGLARTVTAAREALSNAIIDERWKRHFRALEKFEPTGVIKTGWETIHPEPVFIDMSKGEPFHPVDPRSKGPWRLCRDDALLTKKCLPAYSTSLHRYIYLSSPGEEPKFIPITPEAPTNEWTFPLSEIAGDSETVVPLNPGGGMMMVRFGDFVGILSGEKWEGFLHGRSALDLGPACKALRTEETLCSGDGRLFLDAHGWSGRLVETLHLKLRLLADAVAATRHMVYYHKRPLLSLNEDSFVVTLRDPGRGLPFLWTGRALLLDSGDAVSLPIEASDVVYYVRASGVRDSVYQPPQKDAAIRGVGKVRIRKVLPGGRKEETILEGTLVTQEPVKTAESDLVWMRVNLSAGRADLYARLDTEAAMAGNESRFRTVGQSFTEGQVAAMRAVEGAPIPQVQFEIIPVLATPFDLYSLGVLAARTLLVNNQTSLPVALDELHALAHEVASSHDGKAGLTKRIEVVFGKDESWKESLGPHRVTYDDVKPQAALELVTPSLWWDVLAMMVRMFPGMGPDSTCRDFGHAPPGGLHRVFDQALTDLDNLLVRTRSLIVTDSRFNREVRSVIERTLLPKVEREPQRA